MSGAQDTATIHVRLGAVTVALAAPGALREHVGARFPVASAAARADVAARFCDAEPPDVGGLVGRRVGRDAAGAVWIHGVPGLPGLTLRIAGGDPPSVEGWLAPARLRDAYRRVVAGVTSADRLEMLTFHMVIYPALLAAEQRGRVPLHAGAVADGDSALVLAGLPGAGKSTLVAALAADGHTLLSDNIVLLGGGALWPLPEPVKLDAASLRLVGGRSADAVADGARVVVAGAGEAASYARTARRFDPPPGPFAVAALVLVERGEATAAERLDGVATEALLDMNRLALELEAYYRFRAGARLALGSFDAEAGAIEGALSGARVVRLTVASGDVSVAVEVCRDLLAGRGV